MLQLIKDAWWMLRPYRWLFVAVVVGAVLVQLLQLAPSKIFSSVFGLLAQKGSPTFVSQVRILVSYLIVFELSAYTLNRLIEFTVLRISNRLEASLTLDTIRHLLYLPLWYHEKEKTGKKVDQLQRGIDNTIRLGETWGISGLPTVSMLLIITIVVCAHHWGMGFLLLLASPVVVGISLYFYSLSYSLRDERETCHHTSKALFIESMQGISAVQSFRQEERILQQLKKIWTRVYDIGLEEYIRATGGFAFRSVLILLVLFGACELGARAVHDGTLTPEKFMFLIFLTLRATGQLYHLGHYLDAAARHGSAIRRMRELQEVQSTITEKESAFSLRVTKGRVDYQDVSYTYQGTQQHALHNFSVEILPGTTAAFVGPSGSGKSTAIKLLSRFDDVQGGCIRIDGHDIRNLSLDYRRLIARVSQEIEIFSGTIADNIAFGCPGLSHDRMLDVARQAHLAEFVNHLDFQYDTIVGERGINLSGGQRQRLAIARALAADCPIIIFDEATSNLDAEAETIIQQALQEMAGKRTIIIIAHRLSTVTHADQIYFMKHGRVHESGTHQELLALSGEYTRHWELQQRQRTQYS